MKRMIAVYIVPALDEELKRIIYSRHSMYGEAIMYHQL